MDFPLQIDRTRIGLSIICVKGSQFNLVFISMKFGLTLTNSADPNEMPLFAAFHLGLHCLPKYIFKSLQYTKGREGSGPW